MKSVESIYKIGFGPSSSHTMGPERACLKLKEYFPQVTEVRVVLYGSLALTGEGHLTDQIIKQTLAPIPTIIEFDYHTPKDHANTLEFYIQHDGRETLWTVESIGGAEIIIKELNEANTEEDITHPYTTLEAFKAQFGDDVEAIIDYLLKSEPNLATHCQSVYQTMIAAVERGLNAQGKLPGKIGLERQAKTMLSRAQSEIAKLSAYAQAVSEENASGGRIVTAPTCGACGVIPAIIYHHQQQGFDPQTLIRGLIVAGLLGDLVRHNASISGAEAGCQAEIGTSTAMGAALFAYLDKQPLSIIECAATIGLEHQLGLTCDPVLGYVQQPCINRNAMAVSKAMMACEYAKSIQQHTFSFDEITRVMMETGVAIIPELRETSLGGLAKCYDCQVKNCAR